MATHDYVIDNSTGANVRADLNLVLQAILSNNSSSSAPSTTAAYMWWADTSNGILKIRNSSNNGWVELLQLDGTLTLEDGTVTAPALANRSNLNTGIYFSAANTFNITTAGVERMELASTGTVFNEDGADVDFRIEGDDEQNLFYVDAGNDRIGIGTSSPSARVEIAHSIGGGGGTGLILNDFGSSGAAEGLHIEWRSGTDKQADQCRIGQSSNSTGNGSDLFFATNSSDSGSSTERMRIDSSGRVGIGATSFNDAAEYLLVKNDSTAANVSIVASNNAHSSLNLGDEDDFNIQKNKIRSY